MPEYASIGEVVCWDMPANCWSCGEPSDWEIQPQPRLRQRVKCRHCGRVRTLDPMLTAKGTVQAISEYLAKLGAH